MSELADFLLARIADDERDARDYSDDDSPGTWRRYGLAVAGAMRKIVELHRDHNYGGPPYHWPCDTLRALSLAYVDHEDYREDWKT